MSSSLHPSFRVRLTLFAILLACFSFITEAGAQTRVENYKVESGSEFVWDYWQGEYLGWGYDDLMYYKIPFDFTYDGIEYPSGSLLTISPNGWVSFNPDAYMYDYGYLGDGNYPNTIYVLGMDLNLWGSMYAWDDNGKLNLTWEYAEDAWGYGYWNYFQVVLDPKDNSISMSYYGNCWWMHPFGEPVAVGLNGNNGGDGFSYNVYSMDPWSPCENIKFRAPKPDKPALTLSTTTLTYGNVGLGLTQTLCMTVSNTGTPGEPGGGSNPLVFNPAIITGSPAEFTVVSSPTTSLEIGESAQYCVEFKPNAPNTRTSTMTIISNAGNGSVALSGKGVAAAMAIEQLFLFRKSRTKLASHREESFWIHSTGLAPLVINSAVISGEYPEQYSVVSFPTLIQPGDSGLVTVRYSPRYEGLKTGVLTLTTTAFGKNTHIVQLYGTGTLPRLVIAPGAIGPDSVAMGEQRTYTIRLTNTGSDTVRITRDFFTSADRDFTYVPMIGPGVPFAIAPEDFRDISIRFAPISRGYRQARLRIETDIPITMEVIARDTSVFEIDIAGIGVPFGLMSVEGDAMFDSALIGQQICRTIEIWNNGQLPLTVTSADLSGDDQADFSISGVTFPLTIQPETHVDVQVCATPAARGNRSASLAVNGTSNEKPTTIELPLQVFGLLACAEPDKTTAFSSEIVRVGSMRTEQITITNCGDVPTTYDAVINSAAYAILGSPSSGEIAPGASHVYEVQFNSSTMSLQQGTLTVASSTPSINDIVIDLAGVGGNSVLAATNTNVTSPGTPVDFDVTVTNTGNMDWTIGTPVVDGAEFTLRSSPTSISANNGTGTFGFTFTPAVGGSRTANVTFPSSDNTMFSFSLNGTQATVGQTAMNGYELRQNFPNPFAGTSSITFSMAEAGNAKLVIVDVTGNIVAMVADGFYAKGDNTVMFDAGSVPSGNYFYEFTAGSTRLQRAMTVRK